MGGVISAQKIGGEIPKLLNLYKFLKLRNIWAKLAGFGFNSP